MLLLPMTWASADGRFGAYERAPRDAAAGESAHLCVHRDQTFVLHAAARALKPGLPQGAILTPVLEAMAKKLEVERK